MKYVINVVTDIEETIIEDLKTHLYNDVRFKDIFTNFGNVRVSGVHPFVYLIESQIGGKRVPVGLFPSITLTLESDQKDPEANIATIKKDIPVTSSEVADAETNSHKYIISEKDLQALKAATDNDTTVFSEGMTQRRRGNFVAEVWSKNPKVKNRLYDILMNYLVGSGRFTLHDDYDIIIDEPTISGEKSGNYNYDFGYTLFGGFIRFNAAFVIAQYVVDTDTVAIGSINHYVTEVKHAET